MDTVRLPFLLSAQVGGLAGTGGFLAGLVEGLGCPTDLKGWGLALASGLLWLLAQWVQLHLTRRGSAAELAAQLDQAASRAVLAYAAAQQAAAAAILLPSPDVAPVAPPA